MGIFEIVSPKSSWKKSAEERMPVCSEDRLLPIQMHASKVPTGRIFVAPLLPQEATTRLQAVTNRWLINGSQGNNKISLHINYRVANNNILRMIVNNFRYESRSVKNTVTEL